MLLNCLLVIENQHTKGLLPFFVIWRNDMAIFSVNKAILILLPLTLNVLHQKPCHEVTHCSFVRIPFYSLLRGFSDQVCSSEQVLLLLTCHEGKGIQTVQK